MRHIGGYIVPEDIIDNEIPDFNERDMTKKALLVYHDDRTPDIQYKYLFGLMHLIVITLRNNFIRPKLIYWLYDNTFEIVFINMQEAEYANFINHQLYDIMDMLELV